MLERDNYSFSILKKGPKIESSFTQQEELVHNKTMRKKNNKNKKRFSDEQIKSLESIFESETKLDPRMKVEVAKELELQPRQVAIWFQNRRARWKSKQLERDYTILKSNYDDLASKYESVEKEKQALMKQLEKLRDLMGKTREESSSCGLGLVGSITDGDSDNGDNKSESEKKLGGGGRLVEGGELDFRLNPYSDDEYSNKNLDYLGQDDEEEINLMNISAPTYGILASPNEWCSFDDDSTGRLFDPNQSCSNSSQWWEFWPTIPSNDNFEANGGQN